MNRLQTASLAAAAAIVAVGAVIAAVASAAPADFLPDAARSGLAEIRLGNLALEKSQNEEVRAFAQRMVADHTAAGEELRALAAAKNVTLPSAPDAKAEAAAAKLGGLSGADFDKAFAKQMIKDHEAAVKLFRRGSERGDDAETKLFAAKTLPILQGHLDMSRRIRDSLKSAGRSDDSSNRSNGNSSNGGSSNSNDSMNMNSNANNRDRRSNRNSNTNANTNANDNRR